MVAWFDDALVLGGVLVAASALLFALARSGTLLWSANACLKFAMSFQKREWQFPDYPVYLSPLPPDVSSPDNPLGETWMACIENGVIAGIGATPEAARHDLSTAFEHYKAVHGVTPRPGLRWPRPGIGEWDNAASQVFL